VGCGKGVRVTTIKPGVVISEFQEVAGYGPEFAKTVEKFGKCLEPADVARVIRFVVEQPGAVHLNEIVVRPTGQDYP
jgi:NADP-dependent 3-hydroxy acid dehydrogenase YdfG